MKIISVIKEYLNVKKKFVKIMEKFLIIKHVYLFILETNIIISLDVKNVINGLNQFIKTRLHKKEWNNI